MSSNWGFLSAKNLLTLFSASGNKYYFLFRLYTSEVCEKGSIVRSLNASFLLGHFMKRPHWVPSYTYLLLKQAKLVADCIANLNHFHKKIV